MSGLVLLAATCMCQVTDRNKYVGIFVICLQHFLNSWLIVEMNHLSLSSGYYFGRCLSELVEMVVPLYSRWRSFYYSDKWHDFSVIIPRCYDNIYVNSFFPRIARLWNSLPAEYFPLTYDLYDFKCGVNRHLLSLDSF